MEKFLRVFRCFRKLRKATISYVMSVCLSARPREKNSAPTGRILYIWVFLETLPKKFTIY